MKNTFFVTVIVLIAISIVYPFLAHYGLPQLPGDFVIEKNQTMIYFPLTTSVLVSLLLIIIFQVFK